MTPSPLMLLCCYAALAAPAADMSVQPDGVVDLYRPGGLWIVLDTVDASGAPVQRTLGVDVTNTAQTVGTVPWVYGALVSLTPGDGAVVPYRHADPADLNLDGAVNAADLAALLAAWEGN